MTTYILERSLAGQNNWTVIYTGPLKTFSDSGLAQDTEYDYRVKASNLYGESAYSTIATESTLVSTLPSLQGISTDGAYIDIEYDLTLDTGSVPDPADFDLFPDRTFTVSIVGTSVRLTPTVGFDSNDIPILAYTKGANPIQSPVGGEAAEFSGQLVTNNVPFPAVDNGYTPGSGNRIATAQDAGYYADWNLQVGDYIIEDKNATSGTSVIISSGQNNLISDTAFNPLTNNIWILAGDYGYIAILENGLNGASPGALKIRPLGGQVQFLSSIVPTADRSLRIQGMNNWAFSGFTSGYAEENFSSFGEYGYRFDKEGTTVQNVSIRLDGNVVGWTIEGVEIDGKGLSYSGISVHKAGDNSVTWTDCTIRKNYIHDTGGEPAYVGSNSGTLSQHGFEDFTLEDNLFVRSSLEIGQFQQLLGTSRIRNNTFIMGAMQWKNPFQKNQDGNMQIQHLRQGNVFIQNNIIIGAAQFAVFFGFHDLWTGTNYLIFKNNFIGYTGNYGMFIGTGNGTNVIVDGNHFRKIGDPFIYDEVYPSESAKTYSILINSSTPEIELKNNVYETTTLKSGGSTNVTETNNTQQTVTDVMFRRDTLRERVPGYDYHLAQQWEFEVMVDTSGDLTGTNAGDAIAYTTGDVVFDYGNMYVALQDHSPRTGSGTFNSAMRPSTDVGGSPTADSNGETDGTYWKLIWWDKAGSWTLEKPDDYESINYDIGVNKTLATDPAVPGGTVANIEVTFNEIQRAGVPFNLTHNIINASSYEWLVLDQSGEPVFTSTAATPNLTLPEGIYSLLVKATGSNTLERFYPDKISVMPALFTEAQADHVVNLSSSGNNIINGLSTYSPGDKVFIKASSPTSIYRVIIQEVVGTSVNPIHFLFDPSTRFIVTDWTTQHGIQIEKCKYITLDAGAYGTWDFDRGVMNNYGVMLQSSITSPNHALAIGSGTYSTQTNEGISVVGFGMNNNGQGSGIRWNLNETATNNRTQPAYEGGNFHHIHVMGSGAEGLYFNYNTDLNGGNGGPRKIKNIRGYRMCLKNTKRDSLQPCSLIDSIFHSIYCENWGTENNANHHSMISYNDGNENGRVFNIKGRYGKSGISVQQGLSGGKVQMWNLAYDCDSPVNDPNAVNFIKAGNTNGNDWEVHLFNLTAMGNNNDNLFYVLRDGLSNIDTINIINVVGAYNKSGGSFVSPQGLGAAVTDFSSGVVTTQGNASKFTNLGLSEDRVYDIVDAGSPVLGGTGINPTTKAGISYSDLFGVVGGSVNRNFLYDIDGYLLPVNGGDYNAGAYSGYKFYTGVTPDLTPPVEDTAANFTATTTTVTIQGAWDEQVTVYAVIDIDGAGQPDKAQIIAGLDSNNSALQQLVMADNGSGYQGTFNTLGTGTPYDVFIVARDSFDNLSDVIVLNVTTDADVVAPVIVGALSVDGQSFTTIDISGTYDENGTVYAVAVANPSSTPSKAQIKAGQNASGGSVSNFSVAADPNFFGSFTGLVQNTSYDLYVINEDASGNQSAISTITTATDQDSDAPTATVTPSVTINGDTFLRVVGEYDEPCTVYAVAVAAGSGEPTITQIIDGENSSGSAALSDFSVVDDGTGFSEDLTGLSNSTNHDVYVVARDSGNNDSDVVEMLNEATVTTVGSFEIIIDVGDSYTSGTGPTGKQSNQDPSMAIGFNIANLNDVSGAGTGIGYVVDANLNGTGGGGQGTQGVSSASTNFAANWWRDYHAGTFTGSNTNIAKMRFTGCDALPGTWSIEVYPSRAATGTNRRIMGRTHEDSGVWSTAADGSNNNSESERCHAESLSPDGNGDIWMEVTRYLTSAGNLDNVVTGDGNSDYAYINIIRVTYTQP